MNIFKLYSWFGGLLIVICLANVNVNAQQTSADTTRINAPKSKSPFGVMNVPSELINVDIMSGSEANPALRKFELYKDPIQEYYNSRTKFDPNSVNWHLHYYNPQKQLHPALYALLLVGAFFNNRIMTIPEEQYKRVMDDVYGYPTSSSRYEMTQFSISRGVFGRPDITVSGYKTFMPENSGNYSNMTPNESKLKETTKK